MEEILRKSDLSANLSTQNFPAQASCKEMHRIALNEISVTNKNNIESNSISTSKYNWYNCLPKIIFEQFSKFANLFFIFIACLQLIKAISISEGKPVTLLPLLIVVSLNGLKSFLEDYKRKKSDNEENSRKIKIFNPEIRRFEDKEWKDVKEGNIVQVFENDYFPADLVFISSDSNENTCYIDSKNLDGETRLVYKEAVLELSVFPSIRPFWQLKGELEADLPNENIHDFDANLELIGSSLIVKVNKNNFILRGSSLKQTRSIYGIVVYTGHDTKIMKNSPTARSKVSQMECIMNKQIILVVCLLLIISSISSTFYIIYMESNKDKLPYLNEHLNYITFFERLGTWILIFTNLVPISLLVTLEFIKTFQALFMTWDEKMVSMPDFIQTKVQTSTLNEELGQVKFIFSDKTGTLTKNCMEFRKMTIGDKTYGLDTELNKSKPLTDKYGLITNFNFHDDNFYEDLKNPENPDKNIIHNYLLALSLCHTIFPKENHNELAFNSSSPDELALINACRRFGYIFLKREVGNKIILEINGNPMEFTISNIFEFTSDRKRVSVIAHDSQNKIYLFTKGADSVIKPRIKQNTNLIEFTDNELLNFARSGLRTLMIAYREISRNEYLKFDERLNTAFQEKNREEIMEGLFDEMENNLFLLGSTAIEDKLQEDVGVCLEEFIKVGIKVWVLTGDKVDTAKSIAFSCGLLSHEFSLIEFKENSNIDEVNSEIDKYLKKVYEEFNTSFGIVISSSELSKVMSYPEISRKFYLLSIHCKSVLCCRVSPIQKSQVVNLVKDMQPEIVTLAIGDGANDVNMITSAHIGVAILGVEGRQASRASDYAIGQFSFLKRLLFVHGREAYRRNSFVICYNFYKNILFVIPQFWFGLVSLFSGQTLYDRYIYLIYNICFTSVPIVWFGIFDMEYERDDLENNPKYYIQGMIGKLFHGFRFWKWLFYGSAQGFLVFLFSFFGNGNSITWEGMTQDVWSLGSICYSSVVLIANFEILLATCNHTLFSFSLFLFSIVSYYLTLFVMNYHLSFYNFLDFTMIMSIMSFFLSSFCVLFLCVLTEYGLKKLSIFFGIVGDPNLLSAEDTEKPLRKKTREMKEIFRNNFTGSAFSQEQGSITKEIRRITKSKIK